MYWAAFRLEIGSGVGASSRVVVLLEIGLEGRGSCARGLVSEGSTSTGHQIIIVLGNSVLLLLHAPEDKGDTAKKKSTTNSTNDTSNDVLVGLAQAIAAV